MLWNRSFFSLYLISMSFFFNTNTHQCWSLCLELAMVDGSSTGSLNTSHSDSLPAQALADLREKTHRERILNNQSSYCILVIENFCGSFLNEILFHWSLINLYQGFLYIQYSNLWPGSHYHYSLSYVTTKKYILHVQWKVQFTDLCRSSVSHDFTWFSYSFTI